MEYAGTQADGSEADFDHVAPGRHDAVATAGRSEGIALVPDMNNVVMLPEGATLDDISVSGRDLVITLGDGSTYLIANGAVFVPQIVIDGVSVPPMNLAALLTSNEPQPAAGPVSSSGGNFAQAVNPIQDAFELGNLLPYTELAFPEPREEEIYPGLVDRDEEPNISIITSNQPAGVQAAASTVHEAGLSSRGNKPAGTDASADSETTTGIIVFGAPDGLASVALNGVVITGVGQTFVTGQGVLTITSIAAGSIGYSYTLADNVLGPPADEVFVVTVTDTDGDTATATLTVTITDDAPIARPDVDSVSEDGPLVADGNVLTGMGGGDANTNDGIADVLGADGAVVATTGTFVGQYGTLVLNADGSYVYTLDNTNPQVQALAAGETLAEVFPYTLRDGDGDTSETTLTITINGANDGVIISGLDVTGGEVIVDEDDLASGSSPDAAALTQTGTFTVTTPDGLADVAVAGIVVFTGGVFTPQSIATPQGILTITGFTPAAGSGGIAGGTFTYSYELTENSPAHGASGEDLLSDSFPVVVTDRDGSSATASLDVTVIDDVPTARDDAAVSVAEDFAGTVGGNILSNDTQGADGAALTSVTIGGSTTAIAQVGSTTIATTNGVYVINANGDWTFDPAAGLDNADGIDAGFTYVITDRDGDQATATQPITITDGKGPIGGASIVLGLDDQNLAGGSTPAGADSAVASIGFTPGSDAIASIVFGMDLSALGGGLTWTRISDTQITGTDGSRPVVTLDLVRDGNSAQITATLDGNYDGHSGINIDDVADLGSIGLVATDTDGDTATGTAHISVSDDLPKVSGSADGLAALTVDETNLNVDASASFAGAFTVDYGADGDGGVTYALAVTVGPSGLIDTVSGQPVVLALTTGGVVEGRTSAGDLVFTVTVDAAGTVRFNQILAVQHANADDADDAATLSAADLVRLTATVTDGDGDSASVSVSIGDKLVFRDDGPSIDIAAIDGDTVLLTTQDAQTIGGASDAAVSSANFSGAFSLATSNYGADGAGSVAWSFALSVTNPVSGLSSNGAAINLFLVGGVAVGSTAASADGITSGNTIFTLATDASGIVTLTQHAEIDHAASGVTAPYDEQLAVLGNGLVQLSGTATITDSDGDRASDTEHLDLGGNIRFADDGPAIITTGALIKVTVDESDFTYDASANFAAAFTVNYGADGAGDVTYALAVTAGPSGLIDMITGQPVELSLTSAGVVEGRNANGDLVFTVSVDADGIVTLDQSRAVQHDDANDPDDAETLSAADLVRLTATVTDGDGDSESASINIGDKLVFRDDGPVANVDVPVTVLETAGLTVGINLLLNDTLGADNGRLTHVSFDGVNWIGIAAAGTEIPIGGQGIYTINQAGDWTFDPVENSSANGQDGGFYYRITDADGDTSIAHQAVTVRNDEGPSPEPVTAPVTVPVTAVVDDDGLPGGIAGGADDLNANLGADGVAGSGDDDLDGAASTEATFSGVLGVTYGDGGAGSVSFAQLHGQSVSVGVETATLAWDAATSTLTATGPRGELFAVEVTDHSTGAYKVSLLGNVLHASGDAENDATVALTYSATDGNGIAANGVLNIILNDDKPGIFNTSDVTLGRDLSSTGVFTYGIGGDARASVSQTDGDFTSVALSGLVGSTAITNVTTTKTGETATSATFSFSFSYDADLSLAGVQNATSTGSISFDKSTGQYTFTLDQPLVNYDTVVTSSTMGARESFNLTGSSASQPEIVISQLDTDFYVRFSAVDADLTAGGNATFSNGETVGGSQGWVSVSGDANGVSSDTLQRGEALNLDFYIANPGASASPGAGTARADGIFLRVANMGDKEDFVVILKLVAPDGSTTTRAVIVDAADVWQSGSANPYNIAYGNNESIVIIESNDYNFGSENYQIYGVQVLSSTTGLSLGADHTAINLNRAVGTSGVSTFDDNFDGTADNDVLKIVDIGLIQHSANTPLLDLNIDVTITDADGDAVSSTLHVAADALPVDSSAGLLANTAFSAGRQSREAGRAVETAGVAAAASALIAATLAADVPPALAAESHPAPQMAEGLAAATVAEADYAQPAESRSLSALLDGDAGSPVAVDAPDDALNGDTAPDAPAELSGLVDHAEPAAASDNQQPDAEPATSHVLSDGAGTMQAMEALLALRAPSSSAESTPSDPQAAELPVVDEALAEARDATFVDALIDRLGGSEDHAGPGTPQDSVDIAQVLSAPVEGIAITVQSTFDLAQMACDASAQAAAAHA